MTCPICGEKTQVVDSASACEAVYRMRQCIECRHKFSTVEFEGDDKDTLIKLRREQKKSEAEREDIRAGHNAKKLRSMILTLADFVGFEIGGEIILKHKKTRKEYK
jgi:transcriptional regulator NrdR family protein